MAWIYRYIRADREEIDMGPYATRDEADFHRIKHANFGAIVSETAIEVAEDYRLYKGNHNYSLHDWEVIGKSDHLGGPTVYRCTKCLEVQNEEVIHGCKR